MGFSAALYLLLSLPALAVAQPRGPSADVEWLTAMGEKEILSTARLTAAEQKQVLAQVEGTSFDVPESWLAELRVRRIPLGTTEGLVVRSTHLLCGGTGNCQTWVFRRANARWLTMFDGDAPIGSRIGFVRQRKTIRDLVVGTHLSADTEIRKRYAFDGTFYREIACDQVRTGAAGDLVSRVPCS